MFPSWWDRDGKIDPARIASDPLDSPLENLRSGKFVTKLSYRVLTKCLGVRNFPNHRASTIRVRMSLLGNLEW